MYVHIRNEECVFIISNLEKSNLIEYTLRDECNICYHFRNILNNDYLIFLIRGTIHLVVMLYHAALIPYISVICGRHYSTAGRMRRGWLAYHTHTMLHNWYVISAHWVNEEVNVSNACTYLGSFLWSVPYNNRALIDPGTAEQAQMWSVQKHNKPWRSSISFMYSRVYTVKCD